MEREVTKDHQHWKTSKLKRMVAKHAHSCLEC